MVKYKESELDKVFHALADGTRRAILARLANGDAVVTELAEPFHMSLPAISKHLTVLEKAGLLQRHKDGRIRRCELNAAPLKTASQWIDFYKQFWNAQLNSLANYLDKNTEKSIRTNIKNKHKKEK